MYKCELCGKGVVIGKDGTYRHGGRWARRAPKVRRVWKPNLRVAKVTIGGQTKRMRICTKCLKKVKAKITPKVAQLAQVSV